MVKLALAHLLLLDFLYVDVGLVLGLLVGLDFAVLLAGRDPSGHLRILTATSTNIVERLGPVMTVIDIVLFSFLNEYGKVVIIVFCFARVW